MHDDVTSRFLPVQPRVSQTILDAVADDYRRCSEEGLPPDLEAYLLDRYRLDVATEYAGLPIPNPWGKASGQLSMTPGQVREDVEAGLGFIVLKTVIAQDESGAQSMQAWAIKEARMVAEPIVGARGERGWTISWKGRGWWQAFGDYLEFLRAAREIAKDSQTLIVPSCKYHLPTAEESTWKTTEYEYTTRRLVDAWRSGDSGSSGPMPIEKDFSPTLAGSDLAQAQDQILDWLAQVPGLIRNAVVDDGNAPPLRVGLKLFNALFDDDFQLAMLRALHETSGDRTDFYVYANRLFDPQREFDGHRGIAFGGPDLSERNLRVMRRFADERAANPLPWSATGDIHSGRLALEYALLGASSFQLHTFFQLPSDQYAMRGGSKTQKALCELYFHPTEGFVVWMHHLAEAMGLGGEVIRFRDIVGHGNALIEQGRNF